MTNKLGKNLIASIIAGLFIACGSFHVYANEKEYLKEPWMGAEYDDYNEDLVQHYSETRTKNGRTEFFDLIYSRSEDVLNSLKEVFENDISAGTMTFSRNSNTNSIICRFIEDASEDLKEEVADIVRSLDRKTGQILIDVLVVEFTLTDKDLFDAEYKEIFMNIADTTNSLVNVAIDHGNINLNDPNTQTRGFKTFITSGGKMKAFLNAQKTKGNASVISSPHIVTTNHREAIFKTGEKVPIIESTRPSTNGPINSYKVEEVGLELRVTPHINRSKSIDLQVYQAINAIMSYDEKNWTARMTNREATTNLTLQDGQTMVLGGFIEEKKDSSESRVPILSNIPLIGKAFRSKTDNKVKTELMVFITPRILESPEEGMLATRRKVSSIDSRNKRTLIEKLIEKRKEEMLPINPDQEIILDRHSDGWEYAMNTDIIDEIVWRIPKIFDAKNIKFTKKGQAPFGYGKFRSQFPLPVKTYLVPSEGVIFRRNFYVEDPSLFNSYMIKVASNNAAAVYINNKLVDEDPMMKMVEGHEFEYWNREIDKISSHFIHKGENSLVVFLGNDKVAKSAYFDMMLVGNKK